MHRVIPLRGILQELFIPQLRPTPTYTDSQSTIFTANSAAAAKLSVWINRRSAILREGVDTGEVTFQKIGDPDNCANYFTKPVTSAVMRHYFDYTHCEKREVLPKVLAVGKEGETLKPVWKSGHRQRKALLCLAEVASAATGETKEEAYRRLEAQVVLRKSAV